MRYIHLYEATTPFVEKVVDPALMTFWEYVKLINPEDKLHPSNAYKVSIDQINETFDAKDYETLLNQIKRHGIEFEVRMQTTDRWKGKYVKTDKDGNIVRDRNGQALMATPEEVKAMIPPEKRFKYEHAIVEKDSGLIVGNTQDEWGCLLVRVADEYQGFGFGTLLVKLNRELYPSRPSGGFTPAGLQNLRRVHSRMVREYLERGFYSYLVKKGKITKEKVQEIIKSIEPRKKYPVKNLNTNDPKDWLLMTDEESYAIIYDKKIYDFDIDGSKEYWSNKLIKGVVMLGSYMTGDPPFIGRLHGTPKIKGFLIELMLNTDVGNPLHLTKEEVTFAKKRLSNDQLKTKPYNNELINCWIEKPTMQIKGLGLPEKIYRRKHDSYDEMYHRIMELADQLGRGY